MTSSWYSSSSCSTESAPAVAFASPSPVAPALVDGDAASGSAVSDCPPSSVGSGLALGVLVPSSAGDDADDAEGTDDAGGVPAVVSFPAGSSARFAQTTPSPTSTSSAAATSHGRSFLPRPSAG